MRDIRAFTWVSFALLCSCAGDGDGDGSPVDASMDAVSPEAGADDGGAQRDGGAGGPDGAAQDGGGGQHDGGASDGGSDGGARDSGTDAAPEAGPSQDAGRDAGALTVNGFPVADHCAPGDYNPMYNANCDELDGGLDSALASGIGATPSTAISIRRQQISPPMVANQPYSISIEVELFEPPATHQLEIWGAMSPCATAGEQADLLGSVPLDEGTGVYCLDMRPTKAYGHVMMVYRKTGAGNGSAHHGQTYCSTGVCPSR